MNTDDMIFVFGSNEGGIHGAGAAEFAYKKRSARWGLAYGPSGRCFAIPTKDRSIQKSLPIRTIQRYVDGFIAYAAGQPDLKFQVTRIGTGLAGLRDDDIAPLFKDAGPNVYFDEAWRTWLPHHKFWGTF